MIHGRPHNRVARAVAAARAAAAGHGVRSPEAEVLHDGVNVVVHLAPAPVVARVATLTPLLRPHIGRPFGRELDVAAALAAAGAHVVAPSDLLPPGPHEHDGLVLSFWTHVRVLPGSPAPRDVAGALAALHEARADLPPEGSPLDTPLGDLEEFLVRGTGWGADEDLLGRLRERVAELGPRLVGDVRVLHGDAHPGNLLCTPTGWTWTDFEDTCCGPLAWDLACLRSTRRLDGRAAVDAFPRGLSDEDLAPWSALRLLHAAVWQVVFEVGHASSTAASLDRLRAALAD